MIWLRRVLMFVGLLLLAGLILALVKGLWYWIEVHTGVHYLECGSSPCAQQPYYGFFSGFGSDLSEVTLPVAILLWYYHQTCHVSPWWHLAWGKQVEGTTYKLCHKHHPDHAGTRRSVGLDTILEARQKHVDHRHAEHLAHQTLADMATDKKDDTT